GLVMTLPPTSYAPVDSRMIGGFAASPAEAGPLSPANSSATANSFFQFLARRRLMMPPRLAYDAGCGCFVSADGEVAKSKPAPGGERQAASMMMALSDSKARPMAGTIIAASALPDQCATQGITFCDRKPPRLPSVVIAAMAAAAWAPLKICDGRYQKQ